MNYRHRLQYLLVKKTGISNKEARLAILNGRVSINQETVLENCLINPYQEVRLDGEVLQSPNFFRYLAYHKPRGIECTLNPGIANSLYHHLPDEHKVLFYAGRLDKESEGLVLLLNDGHAYNKIIQPEREIEKVYLVNLEKEQNETFIRDMRQGVKILNTITKPCLVESLGKNAIRITLTQGMNRQIRRMCFALGNYVTQLKRIQIGPIQLGDLPPGSLRTLTKEEIEWVRQL